MGPSLERQHLSISQPGLQSNRDNMDRVLQDDCRLSGGDKRPLHWSLPKDLELEEQFKEQPAALFW